MSGRDFAMTLKKMNPATILCAGIAASSVAALGFAYFMQYAMGLDPCHLCLLQRWPYRTTAVLGLAGLFPACKGRTGICALLGYACALIFLGEAGLAFYHVGVEQHWWQSVFEGCTFSFKPGEDMLTQIEAKPAARCDQVAWSLLGVSMAGWNGLLAMGLSAASAAGAWRISPCCGRKDL